MTVLPTPLLSAALFLVIGATGCASCATSRTCPAPQIDGAPAPGDANGDGTVDISDGMFVQRYLMMGGPEPACLAGLDVVTGGVADAAGSTVDVADGVGLWAGLFLGVTPVPESADCEQVVTIPDDGACGRLGLGFSAPDSVTAGPFDATVTLTSSQLEPGPEAWSLSVVTDGCIVTAVRTAGTVAADVHEPVPGLRSSGFDKSELTGGGAVSAVALSWLTPVTLPPSGDPAALLVLEVTVDTPAQDCTSCRLWLEDGEQGSGEPVVNVVSVQGRSYRPALGDAEIEVCAP